MPLGAAAQRRGIVGEASATKQKRQPLWLPKFCLVDYASKLSNRFEDFKKLDDFAQSVEYLSVKDGGGKIVVEKED